jgi:hypothetical protein
VRRSTKTAVTGLVLVLAFGFAVWFWINRDGNSISADAAPQKGMSERVMASRGFIPPGAPLRAPPRPAPRHGAVAVGFDQLAGFEFSPESGVVPDAVQALEGRLVEVIGVMYYSVPDPARVTEFFLMPDHSVCCFGTPRANQIIDVRLPKGEETEYVLDYYLVRGRLRVGPFYDDTGLLLCLYLIEDASVEFLG